MVHRKKGQVCLPIILVFVVIGCFVAGKYLDKLTAELEVKIEEREKQREKRLWKNLEYGQSIYLEATPQVGSRTRLKPFATATG